MTPNTFVPSATTKCCSTFDEKLIQHFFVQNQEKCHLIALTYSSIASAAPFRICRPGKLAPLILVSAVKGIKVAPNSAISRPRKPYFSFAKITILRPSGVSSASEASCAASANVSILTPSAGINSVACRLPKVIVPVLSNNKTSISPAASTARPDKAMTLA